VSHPYHIVVGEDGRRTLTIIPIGESPVVIDGDHPNYDELVDAAEAGEPVAELADISISVRRRLLSERVAVAGGRVYFDGDEVHGAIVRHILRVMDEGDDASLEPLVEFLERVHNNPNPHSREQLYEWLNTRPFTVTREGGIIAYKGVRSDYTSVRSGPAVVDGEPVNGNVPNRPGSTVEIGRSRVMHDPSIGCASGLHVGTYDYASGWAQGALLKVLVDPRDVVSVPTDCEAQKMRVCRYRVLDTIDAPETLPVADDEWGYDEGECDLCEDGECDGWCL
jgi:hypothetical protein